MTFRHIFIKIIIRKMLDSGSLFDGNVIFLVYDLDKRLTLIYSDNIFRSKTLYSFIG